MADQFSSYGKAAVLQRPVRSNPTAVSGGSGGAAVGFVSGNVAPVYGAVSPANQRHYWDTQQSLFPSDLPGVTNGGYYTQSPYAVTPAPGTRPARTDQTYYQQYDINGKPIGAPIGYANGAIPRPGGATGGGTTPPPTGGGTTTPPAGGGGTIPTGPGSGAGTGVGTGGPGPGSTTNYGGNPYLAGLVGTPNGSFASQYTENQQNAVLTNPDLMGRGVLRQMGQDPNGGYGALIADDAKAVTPLVAYLMSQGGQGDPATTLNTTAQLLQNRATAGGKGGIDENVFAQILDPQSQTARAMLGLGNGQEIGDLSPEQQMQMVNQYMGAGIDLGLNPYIGQAVANQLNSAGTAYQEGTAMGGAAATDPYYQYLQQQGFANMFPR